MTALLAAVLALSATPKGAANAQGAQGTAPGASPISPYPAGPGSGAPAGVPVTTPAPSAGSPASTFPVDAPAAQAAPQVPPAATPPTSAESLMLLVPGPSSRLGAAGDAVRQGFLAAHKVDGGGRPVQVVETDESPRQVNAALKAARERGVRVVVGPLSRSAINELDNGSGSLVPMVTLGLPDWEPHAPQTMLSLSIAAEVEARRLVTAAMADPAVIRTGASSATQRRFLVVGGRGAWAARTTTAFRNALLDAGEQPTVLEPVFDGDGLVRFSQQVKGIAYDAVFLALDAREAALVRPRLPRDAPIYATSQINGSTLSRTMAMELGGVRFVEMPWLMEPDHPAVMVYPRPEDGGAPLPIDLQRLYALGIDAYRVAAMWADGRTRFELDGVTGQLRVDRARGARVERLPGFAVIRSGRVLREDPAR